MKECSKELPPDIIAATIQVMSVSVADEAATASVSPMPKDQLREAQKSDPIIHPVLESKLSGSRPPVRELKTFSPKTKCLFREWDKLTIDSDCILYRTTTACK